MIDPPLPRRDFLKQLAVVSAGSLMPGLLLRNLGAETPATAPSMVLYCIGYAHLDTEWRWSYPIVIREFLRKTLEDNFALFEQFPDYIFNFTGANRYRLMKEYYPKQYEQLKAWVRAGRWFPAGSSWEEGLVDEPSSESIVRHVLYGNQYFRRDLGVCSDEFMLPDSFGFPASLPTLLAHAGLKGFSTQKLTWGSAVGIPFNLGVWVGPDGRGVVSALNGGDYTSKITGDLTEDPAWIERVRTDGDKSGVYADFRYYGTGDRGGAPSASSVRWLEASLKGRGPLRIVSATGAALFDALTPDQIAKLPRYQGDLLLTGHSTGTASSQMYMKKLNRKNEFRADEAERTAVGADLLGGRRYPREQITQGWQMVLAGQFHDILAGTCKPDGYGYAWNDGLIARNRLTQVRDGSIGVLARHLDTRVAGIPLVIYNPLSIDRSDIVEAAISFPGEAPESVRVFGPDGTEVPSQMGERQGGTATIVFLASVPSVGFSVYAVRPGAGAPAGGGELQVSARGLENRRYRVTLDERGDVAEIWDKLLGRPLLREPARLAFLREDPEKYPAWNMAWDDTMRDPFAYVDGPPDITIVERGPARVALRVERRAQGSTVVQTIRLAAGDAGDRVEFDTFIDWHTYGAALKAVFPLQASNPAATYNWEAGTVQRGSDQPKLYEWPSHQWFDLTDVSGGHGVSVLEDCRYGSDKPDDHTLRLTLMFTPGLRRASLYRDQLTQDFGRHRLLYALVGHAGDWREAQTPWKAARLNQPLAAFQATPAAGTLGQSFSLLRSNSAQVMVKALKQAEESDEVVVRIQELAGHPAQDVLVELATPILAARECDGQENAIGPASVRDGKLTVDLGGYGLKAFALKLGTAAAQVSGPPCAPLPLAFDSRGASFDGEKATMIMGPDGGKPEARMDTTGRSIPAELLPSEITCDGVPFRFGPHEGLNMIACNGQTVPLPAGGFDRLHLIATSSSGRISAEFAIDGKPIEIEVQNWDGFIGQPDYRLWNTGDAPEISYDWDGAMVGVAPGYLCSDRIAWFCSHRHSVEGANEIYQYCYLFRYVVALPPGARKLTLPANKSVKIFAITAAWERNDPLRSASPDLGVV